MSIAATEHPNATRMREVVDAVGRGDVAAALEHFPEDAVWYWPAARKDERVYHGRDGIMRFFSRVRERSGGTLTREVEDVLGSDDHVVIFLRITATYDHKHLDIRVAHFATVGPNGFARNWFLADDVRAMDRFFA